MHAAYAFSILYDYIYMVLVFIKNACLFGIFLTTNKTLLLFENSKIIIAIKNSKNRFYNMLFKLSYK